MFLAFSWQKMTPPGVVPGGLGGLGSAALVAASVCGFEFGFGSVGSWVDVVGFPWVVESWAVTTNVASDRGGSDLGCSAFVCSAVLSGFLLYLLALRFM